MIAAIVLAAGTSSRFGRLKQLATYRGRPLVQHAIDTAREAGIGDVVVVVGLEADRVAAAVRDARVVHNPRYTEGQSTSLAAGLDALGPEVDGAVVLLGDQPEIGSNHIRALLEAAANAEHPIVRLRFADAPGPALLRREIWDDVRALEGDAGARTLIERRPELVREVPVPGRAPVDIDTPADLERADAGNEKPPSL